MRTDARQSCFEPRALSVLYKESHGHDPQLSQAAAILMGSIFRKIFPPFRFQGRVLEIGCGPGSFLKILDAQNVIRCMGLSPAMRLLNNQEIKGLIYNGMFGGGIYPPGLF